MTVSPYEEELDVPVVAMSTVAVPPVKPFFRQSHATQGLAWHRRFARYPRARIAVLAIPHTERFSGGFLRAPKVQHSKARGIHQPL
jgi:hypothetical protein